MTVVRPLDVQRAPGGADEAVEAITEMHKARLVDGFILDKSCFLSHALLELVGCYNLA